MTGSIAAELLVLRKRTAVWVLLGIWTGLALLFAYVLPYVTYRGSQDPRAVEAINALVPRQVAANVAGGFPFYGGAIALILGVLAAGSEYGWGTLKTIFTQRNGRLQIFGAKLVTLGVMLLPFVVAPFVAGALAGGVVAQVEGLAIGWPALWPLVQALAAGWLILAVWAALGVMLGVLTRGTTLAIGIGILYALVFEGLLSGIASEVDLLRPLIKEFVRANAYSLVRAVGVDLGGAAGDGPGAFSGPFVGWERALLVLAVYLVAFVAVAAYALRRRDVV